MDPIAPRAGLRFRVPRVTGWFLALPTLVLLATVSRAQVVQPTLYVERFPGASVRLSWEGLAGQYGLQFSDELGLEENWQPVMEPPTVQNSVASVQLPVAGQQRYYRLRLEGSAPLTILAESSPAYGEQNVALTRETIVRFSAPLSTGSVLGTNDFFAAFGGRRILSRSELSSDRRTATLFYLENLPASAQVRVMFNGGGVVDAFGAPVDADGDGIAGGVGELTFGTASITTVGNTAVIGHVYASELVPDPSRIGASTNRPLAGVIVTVDGAEETLRTTTDADGFFRLQPAPAGRFFVHVDGRTAVGSAWPTGAYYPVVGKAWEAVAGVTNNLAGGTGDVFLPLIQAGTLQTVSPTTPTTITFAPSVLASNPGLAGVEIVVPPNSLYDNGGVRGGRVGIAPVASDRLPEPLPPGLNFPIVITVQTDGPQNFDQPVKVRFPNLPDPLTGRVLLPGEKTALFSFNHDTGRWEIQGTMTVTADGLYVESDPGVGIRQPGWHGTQPGAQGTGGDLSGGGDGDGDGDIDGDGIPNGEDGDVDGDGVPNGEDPDVDGDGVPNGSDPDVDGDGTPNGSDPDIDGDGMPNTGDPDMDGDGEGNGEDDDTDGDGVPNGQDPDVDADGVPNGQDGDVDGDGTPNAQDDDVDGDGVPNVQDNDADGDGVPNEQDPDADGDGVPNDEDDDTALPCDNLEVLINQGLGLVVCPNQTVTFGAAETPLGGGTFAWTGGVAVGAANGNQYTARYTTPGQQSVRVDFTCLETGATISDQTTVLVTENSGSQWVSRFPGSRSTADLIDPFRSNVDRFIAALQAAGASVTVSATHRPYERAYLMHWSFRIAGGLAPGRADAPPPGVDICWGHLDANGQLNTTQSRNAAAAMSGSTGYDIAYLPSLNSNHIQRRAIDMTITWTGDLTIKNASGTDVIINTLPRHGGRKINGVKEPGNTQLHAVGATYGVRKLVSDPPHWSDDGS